MSKRTVGQSSGNAARSAARWNWLRARSTERWSRLGQIAAIGAAVAVVASPLTQVTPARAAASHSSAAVQKTSIPDAAPDAVTAQINARLSKHRVEVLSERTATTQIFINPDGTASRETASAPVRVKDASASDGWKDVDLDLARNADGTVSPKVPLTDVTLNGGGTDDSALVEYKGTKGSEFSLDWSGPLPKPALDGSVATYADVAPDVDLQVTATRFGFEESFIVKERPANPATLELPLSIDAHGLTVSDPDKSPTSGMTVRNSDGKVVGTLSQADTWDASTDRRGQPDNTTVSDLSLKSSDGGTQLVVKPDAEFLSDPDTKYPVVVDPYFTTTSLADTYVKSDDPNRHFATTDLQVGTFNNGGAKLRTYMKFDGPSINDRLVTSAYVKVWNFHSWSCTASGVSIYPTNYTDLSIATWNAYQPVANGSYGTTQYSAKGYSSSCGAGWLALDATPATRYLVGQRANQYTYAILASETDNNGWKHFDSSRGTHVPVLEVNYDTYPEVPSGMYILPYNDWAGYSYSSSATPTLLGHTNDPEAQPARMNYEIWTGRTTGSTRVATCSSDYVVNGATASCVPSPALPEGTFWVRAQAQSVAYGMYSGWTELSAMSFRTSLGVPQTPTVSCAGYPDGSWNNSAPTSDLSCTVNTTGGNMYSAPISISGDVDGIAFSQQVPMGASGSVPITVSKADGAHRITVRSYSAVGRTQSAPTTYTFGYGTAGISSPSNEQATTKNISVYAAGPPRGSGTASAAFSWRAAGSAAWSDPIAIGTSFIDSGTGSGAVQVNGFKWSTANATGPGINPRRPTLIEIRVCFSYSSGSATSCTSSSGAPRTVLRLPHAFGDGFPTAPAGEGTVALWTGELAFENSDVNVAAPLGALTVSRSHATFLDPQNNTTGTFGPGWSASFGDGDAIGFQVQDSTTVDGTIAFASDDSDPLVFRASVAGKSPTNTTYTPVGDAAATSGYKLTSAGDGAAQQLTLTSVDGSTSIWGVVDKDAPQLTWTPISTSQSAAHSTTTYSSDTAGRITRILAPVPSGVTCPTDPAPVSFTVKGCSALFISYQGTGANTRVQSIAYKAWDPSGSAMKTTTVASYFYDASSRLTKVTDRYGLDTTYDYTTLGDYTVVSRVQHQGMAAYVYNYDYTGSVLRLKNVLREGAMVGGSTVTTASFVYGAPLSTSGFPDMSATQVAKWGQDRAPTAVYAAFGMDVNDAVSGIDASGVPAGAWPSATLHFTDADGYETDTDIYGAGRWLTTASLYDAQGRPTTTIDANFTYEATNGTPADRNAGKAITRWNAASSTVAAHTYVLDTWSPVISASVNGTQQLVRNHTHYDYDEGAPNSVNPATGKPYLLATTTTSGVSSPANYTEDPGASLAADLVINSVTKNGYDAVDSGSASGWTLGKPTTVTTVMPTSADNIVRKLVYDADGNMTQSREPGSNGTDAGTTKLVTYTADSSVLTECGNHPEWAGLPCWGGPAAPPESGTDIPDRSVQGYDYWLDPLTTLETSGSGSGQASRTTTQTYKADGRLDTTAISTSNLAGSTSLPTSQVLYDNSTKLPTGTATLNGSNTQVSSVQRDVDLWGRTTRYTDANGNVTTSTYVGAGTSGAGAVASVSNAKGTTTYSYDGTDIAGNVEHRGLPTQLSVTGLGTYQAAYDPLGNLVTETMPGSVTQSRTYDSASRLTRLSYSSQSGMLLSYNRTYNHAGQVEADVDSTGRTTNYGYDRAGRLNGVADVFNNAAAGTASCITHGYSFDARGNRTTLLSTTASSCQWNGSTKTWAYDAYSRQQSGANGSGIYTYDPLGRQTTIPASDAANGTNASTTLSYYDDDSIRMITQSGSTTTYAPDPAGRRLAAASSSDAITYNYSDSTDNPDWVTNVQGSNTLVSRYVSDLAGGLAEVDTNEGSSTVSLELTNASGAIATVVSFAAGAIAGGVVSTESFDEYGVAVTGYMSTGAAHYGWHGANQRELTASGLLLMGARLYNASTGRFTSQDPVRGGNENAYNYPDDPVNYSDLNGKFAFLIGLAAVGLADVWNPVGWTILGAVVVIGAAILISEAVNRARSDSVWQAKAKKSKPAVVTKTNGDKTWQEKTDKEKTGEQFGSEEEARKQAQQDAGRGGPGACYRNTCAAGDHVHVDFKNKSRVIVKTAHYSWSKKR